MPISEAPIFIKISVFSDIAAYMGYGLIHWPQKDLSEILKCWDFFRSGVVLWLNILAGNCKVVGLNCPKSDLELLLSRCFRI